MPTLKEDELTSIAVAENSDSIRACVEKTRAIQLQRQGKANAMLGSLVIETHCQPDNAGMLLLKIVI